MSRSSTTSRREKTSPPVDTDAPIPFKVTDPKPRARVIIKPTTTVREILTARFDAQYEHDPKGYSWEELTYACVQIAEDAVFDMVADPEVQAARRPHLVALAALAQLTLRAHDERFAVKGGAR